MPKLLVIVGPTASGKSAVALHVAAGLGGEIVSADSRQIYKYLDIGTAKPSPEDRRKIPHHFIDVLDPAVDYSAGEFGREARRKIQEIFGREKMPILVGGSGLYVKAVIDGFFAGPGKDPEVRLRLEDRLKEEGPESLLQTLRAADPEGARQMDITKPRRIVRALEVYYMTGRSLSQFHREQSTAPPFDVIQVGLMWPRDLQYQRINERAEWMFAEGLIDEVKRLQASGYAPTLNSLNTVGYKEVFEHLAGNLKRDDAIDLVKRNSRRFAKRQLTWFRADKRIRWIKVDEGSKQESIAAEIIQEFHGN